MGKGIAREEFSIIDGLLLSGNCLKLLLVLAMIVTIDISVVMSDSFTLLFSV